MSIRPVLVLVCCLFALSAGCTKHSRMQRHIARGVQHAKAGEFDAAEVEYRAALQLVPEAPEALGRIGMLYYEDGRIVPAYLMLQEALKTSDDPDFQLTFGLACLSLAKSYEAHESAKKVLAVEPTNEDALLLLVSSAITNRDFDDSRKFIEQLQVSHADEAAFHVALGALHLALHDGSTAERELRTAIKLNPKSSAAYAELGALYLDRRDAAAAREALKTSADLSPLRAPRRIKYITFLFQHGDAPTAEAELAKIMAKAPDYMPALLLTMQMDVARGEDKAADAVIDKILTRDQINYDALMERAAIRMRQGDIDGAIIQLQRVAGLFARAPQVSYQLAVAYLRKGDTGQAETALRRALLLAPNYDDAALMLAEINLQRGNARQVESDLKLLLKRSPRNGRAYLLLARAFRAEGKLQETLDVVQMLAKAFPKSPESPYLVGMAELDLRHKDEALASFQQSVKIADDYWPAWEMLTAAAVADHKNEEATAQVDRLIKKYPKAAQPWLLSAKLHLIANDATGAESALQHALTIDPNSQYAYLQLARIYVDKKQPKEAIDKLAALAAKTNSVSALMQLGMLHSSTQQYDAARADYEKLLSINPQFAPALNNLAALECDQLGKVADGLSLARKAHTIAPDDPVISDTLGWILVRNGEPESGLSLLQSSLEKLPADPEVQFHLAVAHYVLGHEDAAKEGFTKVIDSSASESVKQQARTRLAVLNVDPATATPAVEASLHDALQRDANDPVVLQRIAAIERRNGKFADAATHYEAALKLVPRNVTVMLGLVELYAGPVNRHDRALELAKLAHSTASDDDQLAWRLGHMLYRSGDYTWAAALLQDASRGLENNSELLLELAQADYAIGRTKDADEALDQVKIDALPEDKREGAKQLVAMLTAARTPADAVAAQSQAESILVRDPNNVPALMVVALAHDQQHDFKGAQATYDRVLKAHPDFAPAIRQLAVLYTEHLNDDKRAEDLATKARQTFPEDPVLAYELGVLNYRKGDYASAARFLQQSNTRRRDDPHTYFYLGLCHFQLKNLVDSRTELQRSLELNLGTPESDEAQRVLEAISRSSVGG